MPCETVAALGVLTVVMIAVWLIAVPRGPFVD